LLASSEGSYKAVPFPITPSSTTGAGDASLAALIYCLVNAIPVSEIAAIMACAGTLSSTKPGTSFCSLKELVGSLPGIKSYKLT
ncbi:MAG: PfkB family carbohydrate kinase, partial [Clostridia bacterium]|nr:PfkB family carbohydrate kinase [Clostridia bacterium]